MRWSAPSMSFCFGCLPRRIERRADGSLLVTLTDRAVIEADQVLIATGRLPNTDGLGLETVEVGAAARTGR